MTKKPTVKDAESLPLEARVAQCVTSFAAPKTTQDSVDQLAAEFATANYLRTYAEKRYDTIKRSVMESYETDVAVLRNDATETMSKSKQVITGQDWCLYLSANKPSTRCDVDDLRTELVRLGVNVDTIDRAISKVSKKSTPAFSISAARAE